MKEVLDLCPWAENRSSDDSWKGWPLQEKKVRQIAFSPRQRGCCSQGDQKASFVSILTVVMILSG